MALCLKTAGSQIFKVIDWLETVEKSKLWQNGGFKEIHLAGTSVLPVIFYLAGCSISDLRSLYDRQDWWRLIIESRKPEEVLKGVLLQKGLLSLTCLRETILSLLSSYMAVTIPTLHRLSQIQTHDLKVKIHLFNLNSGKIEVFSTETHPHEPLVDIILASLSTYLLFEPIYLKDTRYIEPSPFGSFDTNFVSGETQVMTFREKNDSSHPVGGARWGDSHSESQDLIETYWNIVEGQLRL